MTNPVDGTVLNSKKAKSAYLVEVINRCGQVTIEFSYLRCQLFLGVAKDTTVLDTVTLLDAPSRGILRGVILVAVTSVFCNYVYEIIDFLYKGKDRVSGVLEKDGKRFYLKLKLDKVKRTKPELVIKGAVLD